MFCVFSVVSNFWEDLDPIYFINCGIEIELIKGRIKMDVLYVQ